VLKFWRTALVLLLYCLNNTIPSPGVIELFQESSPEQTVPLNLSWVSECVCVCVCVCALWMECRFSALTPPLHSARPAAHTHTHSRAAACLRIPHQQQLKRTGQRNRFASKHTVSFSETVDQTWRWWFKTWRKRADLRRNLCFTRLKHVFLWDKRLRRHRDRCNFCSRAFNWRLRFFFFFKEKVAQLLALDSFGLCGM